MWIKVMGVNRDHYTSEIAARKWWNADDHRTAATPGALERRN
jgi:hypothetical protein